MIICADQILKAAELEAIELRLGNGLGGKAYFTYTGDVAAVKSGTEAGEAIAREKGLLVNYEVIPSPSEVLVPSLLQQEYYHRQLIVTFKGYDERM